MTEAEWLACLDLGRMLAFLGGRASRRKLCLLAVACCERAAHLLDDGRSRGALAALRRAADGRADEREMEREIHDAARATNSARRAAGVAVLGAAAYELATPPVLGSGPGGVLRGLSSLDPALGQAAEAAIESDSAVNAAWAVECAARSAVECGSHCASRVGAAAWLAAVAVWADGSTVVKAAELAAQCALARDLFGNPFCPVHFDPLWREWGGGTARAVASAIYSGQRFVDLPVLADALEDAGCADENLLGHCRSGAAHARGCWALDLVLGRE
jgi:hypothetical protein